MKRADVIESRLVNGKDVTFVFVGDSITYGRNFCEADETYVAVFAQLMAKKYPDASVYRYDGIYESEMHPIHTYEKFQISKGKKGNIHVIRSGVGGNTVARANERFFNYTGILASGTCSDFIFTMFGINDSIKSDPQKYADEDTFEARYRALLGKLRFTEPQAELIVMSATTFYDRINEYVKRTYKICREERIPIIDLFSLWQDHYDPSAENFGHGDWLVADACHPSPTASRVMAEKIFNDFFAE
ncbi:MAG: SGNH/GDSL hydrolase family protein [Clostridia bacterium]|nr:SGNH/GDSL hydrolase family protein [Clostridia bacterium]